ncbi:hypothetical protein MKW94_011465 [Papaver nudicaule]|uniref:histone acetyltransferase n=1 Tax=Papaver nudicaule TaxID=74823 RepID=A0AA41VJU3_PAPNU|nr:hypothetical protein [Papaver nudicaule]
MSAVAMGEWCGMPQLKTDNQESTSNWRQEEDPGGIRRTREFIRSNVEQILYCLSRTKSNNWNQLKFQNWSKLVEGVLFMQAATKEEYADVATLRSRVIFAVRSISQRIGGTRSKYPGVHSVWNRHQKPVHNKIAVVPLTFDFAAKRKTIYGTGEAAQDFSSFKKRKNDCNSDIHITDHQASGKMHSKTFSGYEIPQGWGPIPLQDYYPHGSLPKYKQWKPYEPSTTAVDVSKLYNSALSREASLPGMFIPDHVAILNQWLAKTKPKEVDERRACQLCGVEKIFYAVGCFLCRRVFKKTDTYHSASKLGMEYRVCINCVKLERRKVTVPDLYIDNEIIRMDTDSRCQEPFVLCSRCDRRQHHTCALFNSERNSGRKTEYICPKCNIQEGKNEPCTPLDHTRGAKDLPSTKLSDSLERRLFESLKKDREERAKRIGKKSHEVPGAEDLVVRVVLSVEKKLQVNPELLNVLKEENYPKEFPYRSKVILLFQKIDGVEVCLFGMYVQEYGSKCAPPNQRSIYISYLDSVNYFRPEGIMTASGESLRTFVYHEILLGYLEYCKTRGFTRCYLWSCPPSKEADNYIFNCHPKVQKKPADKKKGIKKRTKSEKLRAWYGEVFRKAEDEKIVARTTNSYDYFIAPRGKHNKIKAPQLPYFEGDYWPLAAEKKLKDLLKEQLLSSRKTRNSQKTSFEVVGCTDASGYSHVKDQLMKKLVEGIKKQKDNLIILELVTQHMAEDTDQDEDEVIEGNIFDGRENFLDFCVQKRYQFDNLQRAKLSSRKILHHLHNSNKEE